MEDLPIFPLNTVLFPAGVLPLRVFEARYVDMVSECMRRDAPFGVCLIRSGNEVGQPAEPEDCGCLARIADVDMPQAGVLEIRSLGETRFRIRERRIGANGLVRASVDEMPADTDSEPPPSFGDCVELLRRVVADIEQRESDPARRPIQRPYRFESSSWIGNRFSELLPIPSRAKQQLMELDDALARLQIVRRFLQQHEVL